MYSSATGPRVKRAPGNQVNKSGVYSGMFEQSIIIGQPTNKSWTMFVSISLQAFLVGIALLVPLMFSDSLPQVHWAAVLNAPRRLRPLLSHSIKSHSSAL